MKIYYVGSFDPPHIGHLKTYQNARELLRADIGIAVCSNNLKSDPLLSLEERAFLCSSVFQTSDVVVCRNSAEIRKFAGECDLFVRGYHDRSDAEYANILVKHYNLPDIEQRIFYVQIEKEYSDISSSRIKELIRQKKEYRQFLPPKVYYYLVSIT